MNRKILILFFHPRFEDSKTNRRLLDVAASMEGIVIRDLYELYPDFNIDIAEEQKQLLASDVIIWQHPFYWYSCPPLMKQWIDLVFEYGWAYGKDGNRLSSKWVMNALSSGGALDVYRKEGRNRFTYREFLSPFDQTAYLCHMHYLPPFIVPGANKIADDVLESYVSKYAEVLHFLQSGDIDIEKLKQAPSFNIILSDTWQTQYSLTH